MNGTSLKPFVRYDHHSRAEPAVYDIDDAASTPTRHLNEATTTVSSSRASTVVHDGSSPKPPSRQAQTHEDLVDPDGFDDWDGEDAWTDEDGDGSTAYDMPSDLRPEGRNADGRSQQPLLASKQHEYDQAQRSRSPVSGSQHSSKFHERDSEGLARKATQKKYIYASLFLGLSLVSFVVQTETAVYIADQLKWRKSYCMLYFTHGSWTLLFPVQLLILRLQKWSLPWHTFWRRHLQILRTTGQMVEHQTLHPTGLQTKKSPVPYLIRTTAFVTCCLTLAGGSWYVAVNLTTASDLTAIYNCSAFFAYAFSVPLLHERLRASKVLAVAVAIVGVLIVAYGGDAPAKHGSKSGGGAGGTKPPSDHEPPNRTLGNLIIAVGSILYGFYEVLYKKVACPPEGCSPGRGMVFANTFGSMIGLFTLTVLWIPLPILHILGWETFELPRGEAAWMLLVSVLSNATFSGSFLVLISLTSPVLSSVAALLTIFIVAIVDELLPEPMRNKLTPAALIGGLLIIGAFLVLSWATYKEMDEERRRKLEDDGSDVDEGIMD